MVLHRPVEPAGIIGMWESAVVRQEPHSGKPTHWELADLRSAYHIFRMRSLRYLRSNAPDRAAPYSEMVGTASELLSPGTILLADGYRRGEGEKTIQPAR